MPIPTTAQLAAAREAKEAARKAKEDADYEDWKQKLAANKNGQVATPPPASVTTPSASIAEGPQQSLTATQPATNKPLETSMPNRLAGASDQLAPAPEPVRVKLEAAEALEAKGEDLKAVSEKRNAGHAEPVPTSSREATSLLVCHDRLPSQETKHAESNPTISIAPPTKAAVNGDKPPAPSASHSVHQKSDAPPYVGSAPKPQPSVHVRSATPPQGHGVDEASSWAGASILNEKEYRIRLRDEKFKQRMRPLTLEQLLMMVPILRESKPNRLPYFLGKPHLGPARIKLRNEKGRVTVQLYIPQRRVSLFKAPVKKHREVRLGLASKLLEIVYEEVRDRRAAVAAKLPHAMRT